MDASNDTRCLATALMLAITAWPLHSATARQLDGERAEVGPHDAQEDWQLINAAHLRVVGGRTDTLLAKDTSRLELDRAHVSAYARGIAAITLTDTATLDATESTLSDGGIDLSGSATLQMKSSTIAIHPGNGAGVGLSLQAGGTPQALVHGSAIRVGADIAEDATRTGIGARLASGRLRLQSSAEMVSTNAGVLVPGNADALVTLEIDASSVDSERGPALWIAAQEATDARIDITVSNRARLTGGDGNLLLARSLSGTPGTGRADVFFTVDNAELTGSVTRDTATFQGAVHVTLVNNAVINGRFIDVSTARIGDNGLWRLTGDSAVGHVQLETTGRITLGDGEQFSTLRVDRFTSNGGTLSFNTALGADTSASDRLIISGDAEGHAQVRVTNLGGGGAQTERGIELITIGGASNAQFQQVGRATAGMYEYFLFKNADDGNWYLRSELREDTRRGVANVRAMAGQPAPIASAATARPAPVLRPEAGTYLANQFAVDQLLRHTRRDRHGEANTAVDGVRGWARVDSTQSRLGAVEDQLSLRVDRERLQVGADVGVFDGGRGRVGLMGTAAQSSAISRSSLTGFAARGRVEGGAVGAYAGWSTGMVYVDASVQRGQFRNRVQGDGLATEQYDSALWQSALEAGYRVNLGQIGNVALSLQPELQLVYTDARTDLHVESNGTVVRSVGNDGLSGRLGLRLQGDTVAGAGAQVRPYLAANWYRDGGSAGMAFDGEVLNAGTPRDRYELSAGGRIDFRSGLSGWGGLGVSHGDQDYREVSAQLGLSYRW